MEGCSARRDGKLRRRGVMGAGRADDGGGASEALLGFMLVTSGVAGMAGMAGMAGVVDMREVSVEVRSPFAAGELQGVRHDHDKAAPESGG